MVKAKTLAIMLISFSVLLLFFLAIVKSSWDSQAVFLCEAFTEQKLDMKDCPAHDPKNSWVITLSFGIAFLILGVGIYMLFSASETAPARTRDFANVNTGSMEPEEKSIIEVLKSSNGSMYQSDLIKSTGLSKVRVSRTLDKLESSGLVERKRRGMTNIVVLK